MECKDCCRIITEQDSKMYNGYCKSCYIEIMKEKGKSINSNENNNTVSNIFKIFTWIFVLITIIGTIMLINEESDYTMVYLISGIISSLIFMAISEVIKLLANINENLEKIKNKK